jgi:hypothetical protein
VVQLIAFRFAADGRDISMLHEKMDKMTQATDNLAAAVQRKTSIVSSVTPLISGLAAQIGKAKSTSDDFEVGGDVIVAVERHMEPELR